MLQTCVCLKQETGVSWGFNISDVFGETVIASVIVMLFRSNGSKCTQKKVKRLSM